MTDNISHVREDGFRAVTENGAEEPEGPVRIVIAIEDVPPSELTTIVLSVELHAVRNAQGLGNQAGEHFGNEDDGIFVGGSEVVRIQFILESLTARVGALVGRADKRINPSPNVANQVIAGSKRIDQVMEVAVAALYAEGCEEFADSFAPAEVLTDIRISANQGITGFGRHNRQEHRGSVGPIVGVCTCSVTEKIHVHPIKDGLGQLSNSSIRGSRVCE